MRRLLILACLLWAVESSAQTTRFLDTFTNTGSAEDLASAPSANHTPETSGSPAWTELIDTATSTIEANGADYARPPVGVVSSRILYTANTASAMSSSSYDVQATLSALAINQTDQDWFCLGGRWADATHGYLGCLSAASNPRVWAIFVANGSASGLTAIATGTISPDTNDILRLAMRGSTLRLYAGTLGTTELGCVVDSTLSSTGKPALGFGNFGSDATADLNQAWHIDDFTAIDQTGQGGNDSCNAVVEQPPAVQATRRRIAVVQSQIVVPNPATTITGPTNQSSLQVSNSALILTGLSVPAGAATISSTTVSCPACSVVGSNTGSVTAYTFALTLTCSASPGTDNVITVTTTDNGARTGQDVLTATCIADLVAPVVTISTNGGASYGTSSSPVTIAGDVSDAVGAVTVTWANTEAGQSGSFSGSAPYTAFSDPVPLTTGTNTITVQACDQAGNCGTDTIVVTLSATLSIDQTTMPTLTSGQAYSRQLTSTGGTGSKSWTNNGAGTTLNDADGDCTGLTISSAGLVSGTHTGAAGTCTWTAKVTDSASPTPNTATQALPITVVASGAEGGNDYFTTVSALTEAQTANGGSSYSLRSSASIAAVRQNSDPSGYWTYVYGTDTYSDPQNAAKLTYFNTDPSVKTQLRFPINQNSGTFLIIWDYWWGPEWRTVACRGKLQTANLVHKEFQAAFDAGTSGTGDISLETRTGYTSNGGASSSGDCTHVGQVNARSYFNRTGNDINNRGPIQPTGPSPAVDANVYEPPHSTWVRYITRIALNQTAGQFSAYTTAYGKTLPTTGADGRTLLYHKVDQWVLDETQGPIQLLNGVPLLREYGPPRGTATVSGAANTNIPNNTTLHVGAAAFKTTAAATIGAGGTTSVSIISTDADSEGLYPTSGLISNGTTLTLDTPISGVTSIVSSGNFVPLVRDGLQQFWGEFNTSTNNDVATGNVTFNGTVGTVILKNTKFKKTDGTEYVTTFSQTGIAIGAGGSVTTTAKATSAFDGPVGNTSAGTAFTPSTAIAGVTSMVAATDFTGGAYFASDTLYSYMRNVIILKNYSLPATPTDDTTIFKRPVR